ncbi:MAG: hypothetical protein NTW03_18445 [Verrucomicrobia bacterium]|nr:hypothetical protein [Verrucomicrobiota bacterium]
MKTMFTAALALFFCAGCGTPNYHFTPYVGQQKNWTTSTGSYVTIVEGVPLYSQYPPQPYELVGAVMVNSDKALARAVKYHQADAALVYQRGTVVTGSVLVGGPVWTSVPLTDTHISANLIRFKR